MLKTAGSSLASFITSLFVIVFSFLGFLAAGEFLSYWNPGLVSVMFGVLCFGAYWLRKQPRYIVGALIGLTGGVVAIALGATEGLGLQVAFVTPVVGVVTLYWRIFEFFS